MKILLLLPLILSFLSCVKAPDCHDERVKQMVLELAPQLIEEKLYADLLASNPFATMLLPFAPDATKKMKSEIKNTVKNLDLSLRATRITSYNKDIDFYTCAGELVMREKGKPQNEKIIHVIYTSQPADSGKDVYVTVRLSEDFQQ